MSIPAVGIGYRFALDEFIGREADRFDILEITLDHYIGAGARRSSLIRDLVDRFPLVGHGVGLSLGTGTPVDAGYMKDIAAAMDALGMDWYSEHLAFTGVPGWELANLLPLPRTEQALDHAISKVREVMSYLNAPFYLENITCYFDYPDPQFDHAEFLNTVCAETGAGVLLETSRTCSSAATISTWSRRPLSRRYCRGSVGCMHVAGGRLEDGMAVDSHDHPVGSRTKELLAFALSHVTPKAIILERDRRLDATDEILADIEILRRCANGTWAGNG